MTPEQGDVLLIPFPFSDLRSHKTRPVLVVSCTSYNRHSDDFLAMAITSNLSQRVHAVRLGPREMKEGDLKMESQIRADKVYNLSRTLVRRKFGSVGDTVLAAALQELDRVLGRVDSQPHQAR
jgi:mRNA interferase MazF